VDHILLNHSDVGERKRTFIVETLDQNCRALADERFMGTVTILIGFCPPY